MTNVTHFEAQPSEGLHAVGNGMSNQLISQADGEFQQGNFETAEKLYSEALEQGVDGTPEMAVVVQKLADSQYALDKYPEARQQYSRLVELQSTSNAAAKDKVMGLLKLAKSCDKCSLTEEAEKNFKAAYSLGKTDLPATHFLNRTVMDGYAEWLRSSGRDPETLAELENVLGIKKEAPVIEQPEVTADTVKVAGSPAGQAREQDHFVVRRRLSSARKRKEEADAATEEASSALDKAKETKQTLDQQVAERKFLRKSDESKGSNKRSSQRAKLRSSMSDESKSTDRGEAARQDESGVQEDFRPADSPAASTRRAAAGSAAAYANTQYSQQTSSTELEFAPQAEGASLELVEQLAALDEITSTDPQQIYQVPLNIDDRLDNAEHVLDATAVAKMMSKKSRRQFTERLEASRQKKAQDASVMSESSRSFIQHAEAVKKADPHANEQTGDIEQLRAEERAIPMSPQQRMAMVVKFGAPVAGVILLIAVTMLIVKQVNAPRTVAVPNFAHALMDKRFSTADGVLVFEPEQTQLLISGPALKRKAHLHIFTGDFADEMAIVQGKYKNCNWIYPSEEGLKDSQGVTFYSPEAPENIIIKTMKNVSEQAQNFYVANRDYPSYSTNLEKSSYTNPFSKKTEEVAVFSGVESMEDNMKDSPIDTSLQSGELYNNETPLLPGAIHGISLIAQPKSAADPNSYSWATHCFYLHACGRDGKLLGSSIPHKVALITLKNGNETPPDTKEQAAAYGASDVCLSEGPPPEANMILAKYLGGLLFVIVLLIVAATSKVGTRRRL